MKRMITIFLVLVMTAALAVPVHATGGSAVGTTSTGEGGTPVVAASAPVVSVDIAWTEMQFTYQAASKGEWNPNSHTYENPISAGWNADEKAAITVTNHSDSAVEVDFTFDAALIGVKGVFYRQNADNTYTALDQTKAQSYVSLATATGAAEAPTGKLFFGIAPTSPAIGEEQSGCELGTITVKIACGTWFRVGTEEELQECLMVANAQIKLTADITVVTDSQKQLNINYNARIDLGGHTIDAWVCTSGSNVTIENGTITNTDVGTSLTNSSENLILKNCKINSNGLRAFQNSGKATATGCDFLNSVYCYRPVTAATECLLTLGPGCTLADGKFLEFSEIGKVELVVVTCFDPTAKIQNYDETNREIVIRDNGDGTWTATGQFKSSD